MLVLNITTHYLQVPGIALMIGGSLLGLVYVILLPMFGAITIVLLILSRTGQLLRQAVREPFSGHL